MEQKAGRPDKTRKLTYETPRVRRVRLDAAGSVLECTKTVDFLLCEDPGVFMS